MVQVDGSIKNAGLAKMEVFLVMFGSSREVAAAQLPHAHLN